MLQSMVELFDVPPMFNDKAGVMDGRAVAIEKAAGFCLGQPAHHVSKIHGNLPGERDAGDAPGWKPQEGFLDIEAAGDCSL